MATGDQDDFAARQRAVLPRLWFPDVAPYLMALLTGFGAVMASTWQMIVYARLQTRIRTATDSFLDLIGLDFFGTRIQRAGGQSDDSWRARILVELLRERGTRAAIIKVLQDLTGRTPITFQPARPADTGGYGVTSTAISAAGGTLLAYGAAGGYGSLLLPYQGFVIAYRPAGTGIPNVGGYGGAPGQPGPGGYGIGQIEYADLSQVTGAVTDADIYAAVASVLPYPTIAWTRIAD